MQTYQLIQRVKGWAGMALLAVVASACSPTTADQPTPGSNQAPSTLPSVAITTSAATSTAIIRSTGATPGAGQDEGEYYDVLFRIPAGTDGITYRGEGIPQMQTVGPAGMTVAPDGSFWILDTMTQSLLHYSPEGEQLRRVVLDDRDRDLVDIAVTATDVFVLDASPTPPEVLRLTHDGTVQTAYPLPEGYWPPHGLTGIGLGEQDELLLEIGFGNTYARLLDDAGNIAPTTLPGLVHQGKVYTTRPADLNMPEADHTRGIINAGDQEIEVRLPQAVVGLIIQGFAPDNSFYVEVHEMSDTGVDMTVRHYAADGTLLGMLRFPLAEQYTYVDQVLAVGPDGALYGMLTQPGEAQVVRMHFASDLSPILDEPAEGPAEGPGENTTLYTHPENWWSLRYPTGMLQVEDLGQGVTIFISQDRTTFAAVDSYTAEGNAYGNTGEDLRNRARDTLARIYSTPPIEVNIIANPTAPWETGMEFVTAQGSRGIAVYQQPGRNDGDYRVYGYIYGYKVANEAVALPMLQNIQATLTIGDVGGG